MSLAGKQEHDGALWVVHDLAETVEVGKQQVSTLISGKATAESDDQCVGIEAFCHLGDA